MEEILKHPLTFSFALIGILGGFMLLFSALIFIYLRFCDKINETEDFKEHLLIGISSLFLGLTIYLTDFSKGLDYWIDTMTQKGSAMPMQYLFMGLLYFALIKHLYKQHIK